MSKVDEELTRRLHRAERPVDSDGLFEVLERRRSHRDRLRKAQAGLLAVAVLAASVAGFTLLSRAFREGLGRSPASARNGLIAFSRGRNLFLMEPDGTVVRQLTFGLGLDMLPTWSPSGNRIAFVRQDLREARLHVLDIETRREEPITPRSLSALYSPAWSPDGRWIAFAGFEMGHHVEDEDVVSNIWIVHPDGSDLTKLTDRPIASPDGLAWSPDSSTIAFTSDVIAEGHVRRTWDVYLIRRNGSGLRNLTLTPHRARSEIPIGWLPNGNLLVAAGSGPVGAGPGVSMQAGRWLEITAYGRIVRIVFGAPSDGVARVNTPSVSPDGHQILFADLSGALWVRDLATGRLTRVMSRFGWGAAWQPIPAGATLSPTASPEPRQSSSLVPEGSDIGLGFNLCHAERLGGIDFLGDGASGNAWIGVSTKDDGTCPRIASGDRLLLAVDHTGDGNADSWIDLPWQCYGYCTPVDATDLDGNGTEELVIRDYLAIIEYRFVAVRPNAEGKLTIQPILVAEPGHRPASIEPDQPLQIDAGGDEGYASSIWCEGYPSDPTLVWAWVLGYVDSQRPQEVHITRIRLQPDGLFHVVGTNDYELPATEYWGYGDVTAPACGVDWQPDR